MENLKKPVFAYKITSMAAIWEDILEIMNKLQNLNDSTYATILNLRSLMCSIKMMITKYKGSFAGLLFVNKIELLIKDKYQSIVENYKQIYSKKEGKETMEDLKKVLKVARESNYSSSNPIEERKTTANLSSLMLNEVPANKSYESNPNSSKESSEDLSLIRQFYYKCFVIKRKLGKSHQGFWVESAPLFNYARKNKIAIQEWDEFIEKELTENVENWIDPQQLAKLSMYKNKIIQSKRKVTKLNSIAESQDSSTDEHNKK